MVYMCLFTSPVSKILTSLFQKVGLQLQRTGVVFIEYNLSFL